MQKNQSLFLFPKIELLCRPHVAKLLHHFSKENGVDLLFSNHWTGRNLKRSLQKYNPDWDYTDMAEKYSVKFVISISEFDLQKFGGGYSPATMIELNSDIHYWFISNLYYQAKALRAEGMNELNAITEGMKTFGITLDDYTYEAAHSAIWEYGKKFERKLQH